MNTTRPSISPTFQTPQYVLLDINRRIGPKVRPLKSGVECSPIYGFGNKLLYDKFRVSTNQPLIPYPLVKRYLTKLIEEAGDKLLLVILDATGPTDQEIFGVTIASVLDAQNSGAKELVAEYRLTYDLATVTYDVDELPSTGS